MTSRRLTALIDAIATGRRPKRLRADPGDVDVLRTAVELRAARPGDAAPTTAFTDALFQRLSSQLSEADARPVPTAAPVPVRRRRTALLAVAAAAVLVTGTAVVTESLSQSAASRGSAAQAPQGSTLRTGTFQTADGQVLGQIVAYRGDPSWVFMNVNAPNYDGPMICTLQVQDGSTVAFGTFNVHNGTGQFSKNLGSVDVRDLRGARLVSSTGSQVAAATFTS